MKTLFYQEVFRPTSCWILFWCHETFNYRSSLTCRMETATQREANHLFFMLKQRSPSRGRNSHTQREKEQESIKRCQTDWACPRPCEDWNNECVLRGHLPPMPNIGSIFRDQRLQLLEWSATKKLFVFQRTDGKNTALLQLSCYIQCA